MAICERTSNKMSFCYFLPYFHVSDILISNFVDVGLLKYLDGTTDITRTVHLGKPSAHEKACYTAVRGICQFSLNTFILFGTENLY